MKVINRKISELKPYKKNAKKHDKVQVERIAESIKEFGFTQPVLIDKDCVVVAGHGRILGAKKAGLTEVPTVCMEDLTEEQIKAYRLIDNKLNESLWDMELLESEIESILDFDMVGFGFVMAESKRYDEMNDYVTGAYDYEHFLVTFKKDQKKDIRELENFLKEKEFEYIRREN